MKLSLNGTLTDYNDATWEQLCDPAAQIITEPEIDAIDPPQLSDAARTRRTEATDSLVRWSTHWRLPWYRRIFRTHPDLET